VLADQIYRARDNRIYCKKHGIRLSRARLVRPFSDARADKNRNIRITLTGLK